MTSVTFRVTVLLGAQRAGHRCSERVSLAYIRSRKNQHASPLRMKSTICSESRDLDFHLIFALTENSGFRQPGVVEF